MEVFVAYFWILKLFGALAMLFVGHRIYKSKFKSKFWWAVAIALVLLMTINPVKLDLNTRATTQRANQTILKQKVLPEKVTDDTFKTKNQEIPGISNEDLK
jgi:glucan phosphoethanolaminetransferase (alkaline phosphatase superfamily)